MLIGALLIGPVLKRIFSSTTSYSRDNVIVVVPNPRHYSSFETLFFPFKITAWIAITTILVTAVTVIIILQRYGKTYYHIVAGSENTTPYLNLIRILLTAGSNYQPKENFARFLFMVWILTSLVLQNVYHGQLFSFIKMNKMVDSVKSVDELIEKGIKIKLIDDNYGPIMKFDKRLENV